MRSTVLRACAGLMPALAILVFPMTRPATGTIDGRVRDQAGAPIANAQVVVVGTSLHALTDPRGHYRIAAVPAGKVSLRAAFIGFRASVIEGVVVRNGSVTTQDFQLEQATVEVQDMSVVVTDPLAPRDEVTTRQRVSGEFTEQLPVDRTADVLSLQPGLVGGSPAGAAVQTRGTRSDGAATYADGVPVAPGTAGAKGEISIATNGFEEASVTTGKSSAELGNAQSGTINLSGRPANTASEIINDRSDERRRRRQRNIGGEDYRRIYENAFLGAGDNPLSTFSIDVDRASYSNVRRFLTDGRLPPPDAVRIEELVNYFHYDYAEPSGKHPFRVVTDRAPAPWNPRHQLVRIGLQGRRYASREIPPSNLVFLIDVSGSMSSPDKLPLVKQAFAVLVERLREEDRVAIVVYAGSAGLVLPSTSGDRKHEILSALGRLQSGGSTAGGEGIQLAYEVARRHHIEGGNNRVILATDGDFNVGMTSDGDLTRLIEAKRREGTYLTVLGFGTGNYKDGRMEQLADKGNGNYAYIDDILEARKVFGTELTSTLFTIAKDVKIQVEFNPARVHSYRLIGYENRMLAKEDFNDDTKDAGELGAGHTVTALYEIVPVGAERDGRPGVDELRYQRPARGITTTTSDEWMTVKLRYKLPAEETSRLLAHVVRSDDGAPRVSGDFAFAASVASFGMILRGSEHRGDASFDDVLRLARAGQGEDEDGYRAEFIRLVERARTLGVAMRD
jgi:Ca-activated chloride channel family protein